MTIGLVVLILALHIIFGGKSYLAVVVFGETFNEERGGLVGLVSVLWDWRGGGRQRPGN